MKTTSSSAWLVQYKRRGREEAGEVCAQVVWDCGLNPEGSGEARKIHTWPLGSPNPYCAKMAFLGQAPGLACYGQVLWT